MPWPPGGGRRKGMALARSAGIQWTAPAFVIHDAPSSLDASGLRLPPAGDGAVTPAGADWIAERGSGVPGARGRTADPAVRSPRSRRTSTRVRLARGPQGPGARLLPLRRLVTVLQGPARGAGEREGSAPEARSWPGRRELRQRRHPQGLRDAQEDRLPASLRSPIKRDSGVRHLERGRLPARATGPRRPLPRHLRDRRAGHRALQILREDLCRALDGGELLDPCG